MKKRMRFARKREAERCVEGVIGENKGCPTGMTPNLFLGGEVGAERGDAYVY